MSTGKKLYRNPEKGMIFGVCAGLAEYFNMDIALMRIIWVLLLVFAGSGGLAYIILAIVLEPKNVVLTRENQKKKEEKTSDDQLN